MKRVIFDAILFAFVFLLPWWATLILAVVGLFVFANFYEFLIASIIVIVIFSNKEIFQWTIPYMEIPVIVFYFVVQFFRKHIILYKNEISYKS